MKKIQDTFGQALESKEPPDGGFKVDFSLLGLRNLTQRMKSPMVTLWLSNNPNDRKVFTVEKEGEEGGPPKKKEEGIISKSSEYLS